MGQINHEPRWRYLATRSWKWIIEWLFFLCFSSIFNHFEPFCSFIPSTAPLHQFRIGSICAFSQFIFYHVFLFPFWKREWRLSWVMSEFDVRAPPFPGFRTFCFSLSLSFLLLFSSFHFSLFLFFFFSCYSLSSSFKICVSIASKSFRTTNDREWSSRPGTRLDISLMF